ncbi:MAG: TonB-dependent receptor [Deltaproteobacteria bacterium]|jgi:vitamin B12 transporter|nr:TonB-dependent receptor [Deltaproteobacteria bacterium]
MLLRRLFLIFCTLLIVLSTKSVIAQDSEDSNEDTTQFMGSLDTVVVTADRSEQTLREVTQSMDVVSGDEMRDSGATNVVDYLKKYGFQVTSASTPNYGDETITIRGLATSQFGNDVNADILILVDGRRAGSDSISFQSLNMIERVEIIRGPGSVQYGAAAMGGVINFITRKGTDDLKVYAETGIGSDDYYKAAASITGKANKFRFAIGSSYTTGGDYTDGHGERHIYTGFDFKLNNVANFTYDINDDHRLNLGILYVKQKMMGAGQGTSYTSWQNKDMKSIDLVYEGASVLGDKNWLLRYYHGETGYNFPRDSTKGRNAAHTDQGLFQSSSTLNNFQGAQGNFNWNHSILSLSTGIDWLRYKFTQEQAFNSAASTNPATQGPPTHGKGITDVYGIFLIAKLHLLENRNLILSTGWRYDIYKMHVDNSTEAIRTQAARRNVVNKDFKKILPSFGIAYSPVDFLKLRASYGKAFKLPSQRNLGGNYMMGSTPYYGDMNIEPEQSESWDVGFDLSWQNIIDISSSYFSTFYDNYISSVTVQAGAIGPDGLPYPARGMQYVNFRQVHIHGIEFDTRMNIGRYLDLDFDLTPYFSFTHLFNLKNKEGRYLYNVAKNNGSAGIDLHSSDWGLNFSLGATYFGKMLATTWSSQGAPVRKGGVVVYDASITKTLYNIDDVNSLKIKVAVNNITDKYYDSSNNDIMAGRTFYVGLVYERD